MSSTPAPPRQGKKTSTLPGHVGRPLTCYFWYTEGRCHKSDAECQYAHWATGLTAPLPAAKSKDKGKGPAIQADTPAPAALPAPFPPSVRFPRPFAPPAPAPLPAPPAPFDPFNDHAAIYHSNPQAEHQQRLQAWKTSLAARELSLHDWDARLGNQAATLHEWEARLNGRQTATTAGANELASTPSDSSEVGKVLERIYNVLGDARTASAVAHGELTGKFKQLSQHQAGSEQGADSMMVGMAIAEAAGMLGRFEGRLVGLEKIVSEEMVKMAGSGEDAGDQDENGGESAGHGGWA